jgi:hypothetical protein
MKAKLILKHRGDYDYFLLSRTENSEAVQASLIPDDEFEQKLSKQNCDEVFGVVNVENLAENHPLEVSNASHGFGIKDGIVYGFNKAMEFNKDKVFTVKDVEKAIEYFVKNEFKLTEKNINITIYSIQNPKYLEVEVLMKNSRTGKIIESESELEWDEDGICDKAIPELDENGCLILKRA